MKNRYRLRSKIDEDLFLEILRLYCAGVSATHAWNECKAGGWKISRQTVEKEFLAFGNYCYFTMACPLMFHWTKNKMEIDYEERFLDAWWQAAKEKSEDEDETVPRSRLTKAIIHTLRERRRMMHGFRRGTFRCHVGFAVLVRTRRDPFKTIKSMLRKIPLRF